MTEAFVKIRSVRKSFGEIEVLRGISLDVRKGEIVSILGPSGSGKSTLLRCINKLESIDAGRITVGGRLVGYRDEPGGIREVREARAAVDRRGIAMVFQRFDLWGHKTALQNVTETLIHVNRVPRRQAVAEAEALLDRVGLSHRMGSYPSMLSGGEQQRVAIARAIAIDPELVLFDEPTSALDPELVGEVLDVIRNLATTGLTMIIVTHEIGFAREISDHVVFMDDGVIVEQGPPSELIANPKQERTRAFLSRTFT